MRKNKKKGSTFVIVIVLMSIIFTLGSAILAVTISDYKIRISESKKLQNLYLADSGLDIVENIISKSTQQIIKYADMKVKKEILNITNENSNYENIIDDNSENIELDSDYINNKFKEIFIDFIDRDKNGIPLFQYLISNKKYIKNIEDGGNIIYEDYTYENEDKQFEITIVDGTEGYNKIQEEVNGKKQIKAIEIKVLSTFRDTKSELKNEKTISTKFKIKVPEYNTKVSVVDILNIYDKKAITIDGNLEATEGGNLDIEGDIWVKGNTENFKNDSEFIFEKYKGGIEIENSNLNLTGNIYTGESLTLRNSSESKIEGNLYAKNLYLGKEIDGDYSSNKNTITITRDVIVNNDLALNDKNSIISINGNFYGINDQTEGMNTPEKALNSSSIIVNESTNSKINIKGTSYIMGVAYLDATDLKGNKYETGESVAIKGNYLAYNDVKEIDEDTILKYYGPLQLIEFEESNGKSSISQKSDYIYDYYSNEDNKDKFKNGVVTLDSVKSVGVSVDKSGNIQNRNLKDTSESLLYTPKEVEDKQKEFILNVLAMGDYTQTNNLNYYDKVKNSVASQIKYGELERLNIEKYIKEDQEENDKEICIIAKKGDVTLTGNKEGLVIVDGDITIEGDFNFSGAIIATGDITFKGSKDRSIEYDANVIKDILADNQELKEIFKSNNSTSSEIIVSSNSEIYNKENFLETLSWKIEK